VERKGEKTPTGIGHGDREKSRATSLFSIRKRRKGKEKDYSIPVNSPYADTAIRKKRRSVGYRSSQLKEKGREGIEAVLGLCSRNANEGGGKVVPPGQKGKSRPLSGAKGEKGSSCHSTKRERSMTKALFSSPIERGKKPARMKKKRESRLLDVRESLRTKGSPRYPRLPGRKKEKKKTPPPA